MTSGKKSNDPHPLIAEQNEEETMQSPALPPLKKPKMDATDTSSDLLSRLNAFLPAMEAANRDLEAEIADGTVARRNIEAVDEREEKYIEMNLGLGILEEKRAGDDSEDGSGSGSEDEDGGEGEGEGEKEKDRDVLMKLLNSSKRHGKCPRGKPSIEIVEQSRGTPTPGKQMHTSEVQ